MKQETKATIAYLAAIIFVIICIALMAVTPAYGQNQTVIKDSKGEVIYVKIKTASGYIVKDKNGVLLYTVVENDTEKRVYDASGRLVSVEKKQKNNETTYRSSQQVDPVQGVQLGNMAFVGFYPQADGVEHGRDYAPPRRNTLRPADRTVRAVRGNPPARRHQLLVRVVGLGAYGGRHSLRRMDLLRHFVADRSDYPALSGRVLLHLLRDRGIQPRG